VRPGSRRSCRRQPRRRRPAHGHAHLVSLLGAGVKTDFGESRRLKVVRYAAAIERACTAALGAEPAYTGRFQHNPLSDAYVTKIGRDAPLAQRARTLRRPQRTGTKENPPIESAATSRPSIVCGAGHTSPSPTGGSARTRRGPARSPIAEARSRPTSAPRARAVRSNRARSVTASRAWRAGSGSAIALTSRRSYAKPRIVAQREREKAREAARERPRMSPRNEINPPRRSNVAQRPRNAACRPLVARDRDGAAVFARRNSPATNSMRSGFARPIKL